MLLVLGVAAAPSPTQLRPDGPTVLHRLLGRDRQPRPDVAAAVAAQGFHAGAPIGSADCAGCHPDIAAQWAGSAHRFASFNNPFYVASVELFRRQRGAVASRFCAGCHDPLLLADGTIDRPTIDRATPAAQAGLVCLVCHSIRQVPDRRGNGGYVLLAGPVPPPGTAAHSARLRPPVLGSPELCGACHKVGLGPAITGDRWLRGQNDFDPWQQSLAAGHGVAAVYRPESPAVRRCQDCHMPLEPGQNGRLVRSHRFLAAHTALPALRGDQDMLRRTEAFLRGVVSLDLVVQAQGPQLAPEVAVPTHGTVRLDVVLRNRRVGHRFPGGTHDSNEVYLRVQARAGDRLLRNDAHLVRAQPVDSEGQPLRRRDPQQMRGVVYDTSLSPSDPQVVRYELDLAELAGARQIVVEASLRYRKFSRDYAAFACAQLPAQSEPAMRCLDLPEVEIAAARRVLRPGGTVRAAPEPEPDLPPLWERYLDHGLGLADGLVDQAAEARPSIEQALRAAPGRVEPLLGLARLELALGRTEQVLAAAERAEALRPDHPAALWLRALALYRSYRWREARPHLERALALLPGDRQVLGLLARVRGLCGDPAGALELADRLLRIDPESEEGHYQRALALAELGQTQQAQQAQQHYLFYRRPVEREMQLRALFRARDPERAFEDVPAHTHRLWPVPAPRAGEAAGGAP
ncbi:MAG: multiheme c-type cytochrome [Myxococcales bacterium]|nr:hypothetical protein [Myxococcota bacterium]MDW8283894.1 multiheme c-type cytochrome [Myxococcales bacterium]